MTDQFAIGTAEVPLHEQLRRIPRHAVLQWENPSKNPWDLPSCSAPVGLLAHQAADALEPASEANAATLRRSDAIAGGYVASVSERDAAVAYRARIACDILEGFTDGIDGDRLGELARWVTRGRALDDAALHRAFAAPWIAAEEEAGWEGDADAEARKDIDRHTITARVRGATSFTPDQLAEMFTRQNQLKTAAKAVAAIRPVNWHDGEDKEQQNAWVALDEALK